MYKKTKLDYFKEETQFVNNRCSTVKEMESTRGIEWKMRRCLSIHEHSTQFDIIWGKNLFKSELY